MKKLISIMLALALLLGLCACTVKIEPISIAEKEPEEPIIEDIDPPVPFEEMTMAQKFEFKATAEYEYEPISADDTMAPAQDIESGLWGYIDKTGKWVIKPKYTGANPFIEDCAAVLDEYKLYKLIDRSGSTVLNTIKRVGISGLAHFSEGLASIPFDVDTQQKYAYVNLKGAIALDASKLPREKKLSYESRTYFDLASPFRNGLAVATRLLNSNMKDNKVEYSSYVIDQKGNIVHTIPAGLDPAQSGFDENMIIIVHNKDNLYALYNEYGLSLTTCRYTFIYHCEGKYYLACDQKGFWGYLDTNGNIVIPFKYQDAMPFSEGLAAVYDGEHWGFINTSGECVINPEYDEVKPLKQTDPDSDIGMGAFSSGVAAVRIGKYWGLIDTNGGIIGCLYAEECPFKSVYGGIVSFEYQERTGLMTTDGTIVLVPSFANIGEFR